MELFLTEIFRPLYGALRLMIFDAGGLTRMDDSRRGAWISFLAPLLTLPLMMWLQTFQGQAEQPVHMDFFSMLRDALGYLIAVFGFPLAMHYVCRYLTRGARYHLLVAAVNWTAPWQTILMGTAYVLYSWALVPMVAGNLVLLAASTFNMVYIWFTIRTALAITRGMAILLVVLMAVIQLVGWLLTQIAF
jgi:hypothetical protein